LGIYDNTLIIITSDNGPANNASSPTVWMDSAAPFRCGKGWGKRSLHEGGIRMPFIVAWGDRISPTVSDYVGYFPDVMPTLCDIAGVKAPKSDGISFLPTLLGM
jgi:arylsulfatase